MISEGTVPANVCGPPAVLPAVEHDRLQTVRETSAPRAESDRIAACVSYVIHAVALLQGRRKGWSSLEPLNKSFFAFRVPHSFSARPAADRGATLCPPFVSLLLGAAILVPLGSKA